MRGGWLEKLGLLLLELLDGLIFELQPILLDIEEVLNLVSDISDPQYLASDGVFIIEFVSEPRELSHDLNELGLGLCMLEVDQLQLFLLVFDLLAQVLVFSVHLRHLTDQVSMGPPLLLHGATWRVYWRGAMLEHLIHVVLIVVLCCPSNLFCVLLCPHYARTWISYDPLLGRGLSDLYLLLDHLILRGRGCLLGKLGVI